MEHEGWELWPEDSYTPDRHEHMPTGFHRAVLKKTAEGHVGGSAS